MTWARLDDDFPNHPKVIELSDAAFRLHVSAICYAAKWRTCGEITQKAFRILGGRPKLAAELVEAAVWDTTEREGAEHGLGWAIHDFEVYNPTRTAEVTDELRATRAAAGRQGGLASGATRREQRLTKTAQNSEANLVVASEAPSRPVPIPSQESQPPMEPSPLSTSSERDILEAALSKLPTKYQYDATVRDEMQSLARSKAGKHLELAQAIEGCREAGVLPFAGNLRKHWPAEETDDLEARKAKYNGRVVQQHAKAKAAP